MTNFIGLNVTLASYICPKIPIKNGVSWRYLACKTGMEDNNREVGCIKTKYYRNGRYRGWDFYLVPYSVWSRISFALLTSVKLQRTLTLTNSGYL